MPAEKMDKMGRPDMHSIHLSTWKHAGIDVLIFGVAKKYCSRTNTCVFPRGEAAIMEDEEWRSQQIASGEAKDNANFHPLGGDWNVIHSRNAVESARKEIALWFPEGIAEWRSSLHPWIYE
ncbi:unnamed protein product [Fraxinus pennsylvanica]|uniref:Uncharacterized protein n=1 Tax=Fraxinus pennsylvanica TaxID=56036 RepID=A0AAD1YTK0_9LAMI|nr:unnamed protein product [Fraxinus pennsylvanica]